MSGIPEGVETIHAEARDVKQALAQAAEQLGVPAEQLGYKLDLAHFRSSTGGSQAKATVAIYAWGLSAEEIEAKAAKAAKKAAEPKNDSDDREDRRERRERRPREKRSRDDRPRRDDRPERKGACEGTTEASEFAGAWFNDLLKHMGMEGEVSATGDEERVHLVVKLERAGRIIGRRGSTLGAIRHLLRLAVAAKFSDLVIDVDVDGGDEPKKSDDRKGRKSRKDDGDRRRGDRRERRGRKGGGGKHDEDYLRRLAQAAAKKATDEGRAFTVKLELNSYDRRIVHLEISEIDGVDSESVVKDGVKYIKVSPV